MFLQPQAFSGWGFFIGLLLTFIDMENIPDQPTSQPDPSVGQKQLVEDAINFLSICDRLSTGYDSEYY